MTGAAWLAVCCLLMLLAGSGRAIAAAPDSVADLTGLADATVGISQLTADGVQCGLDLSQIGAAARQSVSDAGITLRDEALNRVTISAVTARVGPDQCATALLLGVYAKQSFFSAAAGWVQSGYVVLWQRSLMVATPIGQHAAAVLAGTRRLSDQLLADWRAKNPAPVTAATRLTQPAATQ
jgi:hypothetical protein